MSEQNLPRHSDEEAEIAALAYRFYCEEGCPEGKADEHWTRAEREVRGKAESASETSQTEPAGPRARAENPPLEE